MRNISKVDFDTISDVVNMTSHAPCFARDRLIGPLHDAMGKLLYRIDADTDAFGDFQAAMRLPKGTDEEKVRVCKSRSGELRRRFLG